MSSDINNNDFQNSNMYIPAQQQQVKVEKSAIEKTFKNLMAPVFDFFTKEDEKDVNVLKDYSDEIAHYEMRVAETEKILNDADPNSRNRLNIVI